MEEWKSGRRKGARLWMAGMAHVRRKFDEALRSVAIGRKNWLFFGSDAGGQAAAVFFSLIASAKRHDLDPFEYLRDLFERLPAHPAKDRGDFLPDRWKALREKRSAEAPELAAAGD